MPRRHLHINQADSSPGGTDSEMNSVPLLRVPRDDEFEAHVSESDYDGLAKRDRKTVFHMNVLEQWSDWHTDVVILQNSQLRDIASEMSKCKTDLAKLKEEQKEQGWKLSIGKFLVILLATAAINMLFRLFPIK